MTPQLHEHHAVTDRKRFQHHVCVKLGESLVYLLVRGADGVTSGDKRPARALIPLAPVQKVQRNKC